MKIKILAVLALTLSTSAFSQVLTGCNNCNLPTYQPAQVNYNIPQTPGLIVDQLYTGGRLDQMIDFIRSMEGLVDYYTYGEVFLPLKLEIGSLKSTRAVYGPAHRETFNSTLKFLEKVDSQWGIIANYKNTEMFFETINYFELIILRLKRDTYL